jgi:cbb3-type cytochrome oxidase maturation protein
MTALAWLVPIALFLGTLALAAFMWALRSRQFEDLEGAAYRALEDDPLEDEDLTKSERRSALAKFAFTLCVPSNRARLRRAGGGAVCD